MPNPGYIVVGAGSAGGVVASRLSEDADRNVLLLEAAPDYESEASTPPDLLDGGRLAGMAHDWNYTAVPSNGRTITQRREKARLFPLLLHYFNTPPNVFVCQIQAEFVTQHRSILAMIDIDFRGILHGIAAALPVFQRQKDGHFVNVLSLAGVVLLPKMGVYAATKNPARSVTEVLRMEAGPDLCVTGISPGMVATDFTASITNEAEREAIRKWGNDMAIPPEAIARAIAFAIEQPREVDINNIHVRPTAQIE